LLFDFFVFYILISKEAAPQYFKNYRLYSRMVVEIRQSLSTGKTVGFYVNAKYAVKPSSQPPPIPSVTVRWRSLAFKQNPCSPTPWSRLHRHWDCNYWKE